MSKARSTQRRIQSSKGASPCNSQSNTKVKIETRFVTVNTAPSFILRVLCKRRPYDALSVITIASSHIPRSFVNKLCPFTLRYIQRPQERRSSREHPETCREICQRCHRAPRQARSTQPLGMVIEARRGSVMEISRIFTDEDKFYNWNVDIDLDRRTLNSLLCSLASNKRSSLSIGI